MDEIEVGSVTLVKNLQYSKTSLPRFVTELGITIERKELQAKAPIEIVIKDAGSLMDLRDLQR